MDFRGRTKEDPEINLIPMIDVLLVIIIFLMLTTTYSKFAELQISLPTADAEKQLERANEINVVVSVSGQYLIQRKASGGDPGDGRRAPGRLRAGRVCRRAGDEIGRPAARRSTMGRGFAARHWYRLSPVSLLLYPVGLVFGLAVRLRRLLYRLNLLASVRLPVPVIVVGNLTVGGTGK